jgi:GT2 family glycosyltransferase
VFLTYEITEGAVAFRKRALEEAGYYPDGFFLSHEGPDLAFRIINTGYDVVYNPAVSVIHCHSESGRRKWYNYYYDTRNQFGVATRNFPVGYSIRFLIRGIPSMLLYSIRDGYVMYWIRGVLDGLAGMRRWTEQRKVLSGRTMYKIRTIDARRPSLSYMLKRRLARPSARL